MVEDEALDLAGVAGCRRDDLVPAGVGEQCQGGAAVVGVGLTAQPAPLWESWRTRSPGMFFEQSQVEIARALETPRPVSAWQNAMVINADGTQGADFNRLVDSHIKASVSEDISSVILMVDTTATGGATFGQLADYIAMISLARIDLDADFGDAGSILRVFAKNAQGAPKRLTNWDHAFLKALYQPDRALLLADKIIDGKPDYMGTFECDYDAVKQTLTSEFTIPRTGGKGVWLFKIDGDKMDGTLTVFPENEIGRRVKVNKVKPDPKKPE